MLPYRRRLKNRARELRSSMTDAETVLWTQIRRRQLLEFQFLRQRPIGGYIVDFYCPALKLIVEIDGESHLSKDAQQYDNECTVYFESLNLHVHRFTNNDVYTNIEGVITQLKSVCKAQLSNPR